MIVLHFYYVIVIAFGVVLHMLESDAGQLLVARFCLDRSWWVQRKGARCMVWSLCILMMNDQVRCL